MTKCKILAKQSEGIHFIKGNISTVRQYYFLLKSLLQQELPRLGK